LNRWVQTYTVTQKPKKAPFGGLFVLSFGECAELYIESQAPGWSNPKHIEQWRSTLKNLAGPTIGHLSVNHVDSALVIRCLEPATVVSIRKNAS